MSDKGSTTKRDLLQIMMFTFYLCALFFGAWGGYLHWQVKELAVQSKGHVDATRRMHDELKKDETRAMQKQYLQLQELKGGGKSLSYAVEQVRLSMADQVRPAIIDTRTNERKAGDKYTELEFSFKFEPTKLDHLIAFFGQLEANRPDIRVAKATLTKKRKPGTDDAIPGDTDGWTAEAVKLVSYVPKESNDATAPEEEGSTAEEPPGDDAAESPPEGEPTASTDTETVTESPAVPPAESPTAAPADASDAPAADSGAKPETPPAAAEKPNN